MKYWREKKNTFDRIWKECLNSVLNNNFETKLGFDLGWMEWKEHWLKKDWIVDSLSSFYLQHLLFWLHTNKSIDDGVNNNNNNNNDNTTNNDVIKGWELCFKYLNRRRGELLSGNFFNLRKNSTWFCTREWLNQKSLGLYFSLFWMVWNFNRNES